MGTRGKLGVVALVAAAAPVVALGMATGVDALKDWSKYRSGGTIDRELWEIQDDERMRAALRHPSSER